MLWLRKIAAIALLTIPLAIVGCGDPNYDASQTDAAGSPQQLSHAESLEESMRNLLEGTMHYQVADSMNVGETEVVSLRISSKPNDEKIAAGLPGVSGPVQFADSMRATLYGGNDFSVNPRQSNDAQLVPPTGYATWSWDVKALHAGSERLLTLRLDTYVRVNGRDVFYGTSKETRINVKVNPARVAFDFAKDHLEWLWGLLIVPLGAFARRALLGRSPQPKYRHEISSMRGEVGPASAERSETLEKI